MSEKHDQFCKELGNKNVTKESESKFFAAATESAESRYQAAKAIQEGSAIKRKIAEDRIEESKKFAKGIEDTKPSTSYKGEATGDESNRVFAALNGLDRD